MIAGDLLGERARLTPDKIALVEVRSGRRFTYAELDGRAAAVARWWAERGFKKGDRVGILSENRVEYVASFFATGKSGVVLVPLSTRLAAPELAAVTQDAGVRFVMESAAFAEIPD